MPDRAARAELLRRHEPAPPARAMRTRLAEDKVGLAHASRRLGDPRLVIAAHQQSLDDREARLASWARAAVSAPPRGGSARSSAAFGVPASAGPSIARERAEMARLAERLQTLWRATFERRASSVQRVTGRLDALSPLKVLSRGYAIATRTDGQAVQSASDVAPGDVLHVRVRDARVDATGHGGRSGWTEAGEAGDLAVTPCRFAVIGDPVAHSKSPAMHAAAYRALGLPHSYVALRVTEAELPGLVQALRDGTYDGLNVTVPHKQRVLALADEVDASARDVGAANALARVGRACRGVQHRRSGARA